MRFCEDLGITADMASKLYIYYGLSSAIARVLAGRLCDIRGINPVYLYQSAEFVVGLSTILVTLANDYTALIVFVVIYGFCDGTFITTLNIILLTSVDASKRAAALGWNMQFTTIFMASGPPLAGRFFCPGVKVTFPASRVGRSSRSVVDQGLGYRFFRIFKARVE